MTPNIINTKKNQEIHGCKTVQNFVLRHSIKTIKKIRPEFLDRMESDHRILYESYINYTFFY